MSLIDRVGTFLGYAPIHGVDTTKNGYPQLILQCEASHYYDEEVEDYVEVAEQELRAYLVLYGKDGKPLRNCGQVQKVFGWNGLSFQALAEMDLSETRFLFRVEENTYEGNTSLQISWIDDDEANPTRQVSSLDTKSLQGLDAKFGLAKVGKKTDKKKPVGKPTVPGASKKTTKETTKKKDPELAGPPAPVEAPVESAPMTATEAIAAEEKTGSTTRDAAWQYITDEIPEAALSIDDRPIAWTKAIEKIHGGPDDDTLTGEEWFKVQQLIVKEAIPF